MAPLNPIYTDAEVEAALREHGSQTIVVTLTRFYHQVKRVQPRTQLRQVIATNIKEYFPPLLRTLFTLLREAKSGDRVTLAKGDHDSGDAASPTRAGRREAGGAHARRSGRAADERRHDRHGQGRARHARRVHVDGPANQGVERVGARAAARTSTCVPLPLFHVYANVGVQALAFVNGGTLALVPESARPERRLLPRSSVSSRRFFNGVPTLFIALLNHPDVQRGKVDFKSIKICFSGAAALLADTKRRFEALTGGRIVEGYSLTEAMMALCVNPVQGPEQARIGRHAAARRRTFASSTPTRARACCPPDEVGEICLLRAAADGWGTGTSPDETPVVLREHVGTAPARSRWLHTGDLGYLDEDGYLFIVDRKKD